MELKKEKKEKIFGKITSEKKFADISLFNFFLFTRRY